MRHIVVAPWKIVRGRCWLCMETDSVAKLGEAMVCEDCATRALATFEDARQEEDRKAGR
jgi:hypothetical protein